MSETKLTDAAYIERERSKEILAMGKHYQMLSEAQQAISDGTSTDAFRAMVLDKLQSGASQRATSGNLGLTQRERERFSVTRALRALADPAKYRAEAGFELEVSRAMEQDCGRSARGFMVPLDLLAKRDLITGTATSTAKGGNLVQTDVLGAEFIEVLRNRSVVAEAGATFLPGLRGNIAIPKRTTGVTAYWVPENTAPTEGTNVFGQVTMSPKSCAAYMDISRRLMLQSAPAVDALVQRDLIDTIMAAVDSAAIGGATTNGPTGVRGTSGIGSVAIGTNGGTPTWTSVHSLIKTVAVANALTGSLAFITNEKVRFKLATTAKQSSGVEGNFILGENQNVLAGYKLLTTNAVPSNLTKGSSSGVCSAMLYGNWKDLLIGLWSGLDITIDPYSLSTQGALRIVAYQDVDVAVRYPESFAACLDMTTV